MPLGWREQQSGTAQAYLTRRLLWPPLSSNGENLCSSCFEQRKEHFIAAWWILRILICYPLDLKITETWLGTFLLFGLCVRANPTF